MRRNTLRYHQQRPLVAMRDMRGTPMTVVAEQAGKHREKYAGSMHRPEVDAIKFYMLNHAMALVRQRYELDEPLPADVLDLVETYHREVNDLALCLFTYLCLICTRETRHGHKPATLEKKVTDKLGEPEAKIAWNFHMTHVDSEHSGGAASAFITDAPEGLSIGAYCELMCIIFYACDDCGWSGGYGGPKWGVIADVLRDYVTGRVSAEMMLDTGFTLAHNGGPIFNKGMCYSTYNGSALMMLLDVQASGQMPQAVADPHTSGVAKYISSEVKALWKKCRAVLGDTFDGYVDWYVVEVEGKLEGYSVHPLQQAQVQKHGHSPKAAEVEQLKAAKAAKVKAELEAEQAKLKAQQVAAQKEAAEKAEAEAAKEAEFKATHYEWSPGKYITKTQRKGKEAA